MLRWTPLMVNLICVRGTEVAAGVACSEDRGCGWPLSGTTVAAASPAPVPSTKRRREILLDAFWLDAFSAIAKPPDGVILPFAPAALGRSHRTMRPDESGRGRLGVRATFSSIIGAD